MTMDLAIAAAIGIVCKKDSNLLTKNGGHNYCFDQRLSTQLAAQNKVCKEES